MSQFLSLELGTYALSTTALATRKAFFSQTCGTVTILRELPVATANPGDARVKVGSDRQAASSPNRPKVAVDEIGHFSRPFCPRGPSKIGASIGRLAPTKVLEGTLIVLKI